MLRYRTILLSPNPLSPPWAILYIPVHVQSHVLSSLSNKFLNDFLFSLFSFIFCTFFFSLTSLLPLPPTCSLYFSFIASFSVSQLPTILFSKFWYLSLEIHKLFYSAWDSLPSFMIQNVPPYEKPHWFWSLLSCFSTLRIIYEQYLLSNIWKQLFHIFGLLLSYKWYEIKYIFYIPAGQ